jgi:hypothetical protein
MGYGQILHSRESPVTFVFLKGLHYSFLTVECIIMEHTRGMAIQNEHDHTIQNVRADVSKGTDGFTLNMICAKSGLENLKQEPTS